MRFHFTVLMLILTICLGFIINYPSCSFAETANQTISNSSNSDSVIPTPSISKNSNTYKILVGLSVISVIILLITFKDMIISLFSYTFLIGSLIWTAYSGITIYAKKSIGQSDYIQIGSAILLFIISIVILRLANGNSNNWGNSSKSSAKEQSQAKDEYNQMLRRAKLAYISYKEDLSKGKLQKTTTFVGNDLLDQLNIRIDGMKAENYLLQFDNLRIKNVTVKKKAVENQLNNTYIEIVANASRYKIDCNTNQIIAGSENSNDFAEVLCFSKKAGCKVNPKGLIEGFCPKCGAVINKLKRTENCSRCNAELRSGDYDMFLSAIIPADEFQARIEANKAKKQIQVK